MFCECTGEKTDSADAEYEDGLALGEAAPTGGVDEDREGFCECCMFECAGIGKTAGVLGS